MNRKIFNKALFVENLKRFWSVSAVAFFAYYISGIDYIRIRINSFSGLSYYNLSTILTNRWFWIVIHFTLAVVAAFVVFDYLHQHKATNMLHSMPLNRTSLFVTNYVSGLVLCIVPLILTAIMLFVFKTPVMSGGDPQVDIYTAQNILAWLYQSFVYVFYTYSFTVIGLIVSGSSVIAALTGIAANGIIPVIVACLLGFMSQSYWGFVLNSSLVTIFEKTSPFAMLIEGDYYNPLLGSFRIEFFLYIVAGVIVSVIAYYLYTIRKNEKVEDAYAFNFFETFVGFIFVFVPSSVAGLVLFDLWGPMAYVYGGAIGFVIGQMITRKTFKIIDKKGIKNLIAFTIAMALIIVGFSIDFFGYEKKVPAANDVESVRVYSYALKRWTNDSAQSVKFTESDDIQDVINMHKDLVQHKDELLDMVQNSKFNGYYTLSLDYELKNGKLLSREYNIPNSYFVNSESFEKVYQNSLEQDKSIDNLSLLKDKHSEIRIFLYEEKNEANFFIDSDSLDKELYNSLFDAIAADLKSDANNHIFDNLDQKNVIIGNIELWVDGSLKQQDEIAGFSHDDMVFDEGGEGRPIGIYSFYFHEYDTNLLNWIEKAIVL